MDDANVGPDLIRTNWDRRSTARSYTRWMRLRSLGLAAAIVGSLVQLCAPAYGAAASPAQVPAQLAASVVVVDGTGNGHGRGLSQWGAYGWAVYHGSTWQNILAHYYGGTVLGGAPNSAIGVRLTALDGAHVTGVISTVGAAAWNGAAYGGLQAEEIGPNRYRIWGSATPECPGSAAGWSVLAENVPGPITITTPLDQSTAAAATVLGVCEPNGSVVHYRGAIHVLNDSAGDNRTVNEVLIESYLRGVIPREVPASWGNAGNGAGMNALRAQSVAARSFALTQGRYSYAGTCDTSSCQVYGGAAARTNAGAPLTGGTCEAGNATRECANTNGAIAQTAGVVVAWPDGRIVSAEFSASNGPRTAGGAFPAVDDPADNVPGNPLHRWTRQVDAAAVAARYGLGVLEAASTERDPSSPYDGIWGNRVRLRGSAGTVVVSALDFRNAFGLPSHGFVVRESPWYSVGGPYGSHPTAVHTPTSEFLFAVDAAGRPYMHQRFGGQWSGAMSMDGLFISPVTAAERDPQRSDVEVFGVGLDGAVWYSNLTFPWRSIGGLVTSAPAAAQLGNRTFVFVVGWDGGLYYQELSGSVPLGWHALGGHIVSDPAVIVDGGNLHVIGAGGDGALWTRQLSGSGWSPWQTLGGFVTSAPTAISRPAGHVFAIGADRGVWYRPVSGGQWGAWTTLGGGATSKVALAQSRDGLMAFVVGLDGAVHHRMLTGGGWTWWASLGGAMTSHPAAGPTEVVGLGSDRWLWVKGYLAA